MDINVDIGKMSEEAKAGKIRPEEVLEVMIDYVKGTMHFHECDHRYKYKEIYDLRKQIVFKDLEYHWALYFQDTPRIARRLTKVRKELGELNLLHEEAEKDAIFELGIKLTGAMDKLPGPTELKLKALHSIIDFLEKDEDDEEEFEVPRITLGKDESLIGYE